MTTPVGGREVLAKIPHLSDLGAAELDAIAAALEAREAADGEVLIAEGSRTDRIFLVIEGEVAVSSRASGAARELLRFRPGALFGLLAMIDDLPAAATCAAAGRARVGSMTRSAWAQLAAGSAALELAFQRALGAQLAQDFRNVAQKVREMLARTAEPAAGAAPAAARAREAEDENTYDAVVMGGGPVGLFYATFLKKMRPQTRIAVVERRGVPGYKIGEALIGATTKCLRTLGIAQPVMRRLFNNKEGLRFFWTDTTSDQLQCHMDAGGLHETFQVERRVLEMALLESTRRHEVRIFEDTRVDVRQSSLDGAVKELHCTGPDDKPFTLKCRVICDATGPASVLPRFFGSYRKDVERLGTFQANSYYGYFRYAREFPMELWNQPFSRQITFPQGWMWFINLISWEASPDDKLRGLVRELVGHPAGPDESYPTRASLAEKHGCSFSPTVSIGFTVRDDQDTAKGLPIAERFQHYVNRYPAIARVLACYEHVPDAYRKHPPYGAFMDLAHYSDAVAGDGWVAVGDAAMFTNALFSPGLNFGAGTAFMAAQDTARGLEAGDLSRAAFAPYQKYASDIFGALLSENDILFRGFRDVDSFERVLALKFFSGTADLAARPDYGERDAYTFDLLNPAYTATVQSVRDALRRGEAAGTSPREVAAQVRTLVDPHVGKMVADAKARGLKLGRVFAQYDDDGIRREDKKRERNRFATYRCACKFYVDDTLPRCYVCGRPSPLASTS